VNPLVSIGQFILFLFISTSCLTVQKLNTSLEKPHIDITSIGELTKPFPTVSIPKGIEVDSVFYPSGFIPQSYSTRAGILVIPLLVYNRFQTNYQTLLGARQFDQPINEAFKERFRSLLHSCEDSLSVLKKGYKLTMDLQSCQVQGIYVYGSWSSFYVYGTVSGTIAHGRNASSFVRIRWELSEENESVVSGNVMVTLKDSYLGQANGFLTANGQRIELSKENLIFGIPFQTQMANDIYLNPLHINKMVQVLCLSLDKASETILKDIQNYFTNLEKIRN
jgi:hypothetical protein